MGRVGVAEAELDGSDLEGGFVGDLQGEFRGALVVGFLGHEAHRLVERAFADVPGVLGPVLFAEFAIELFVQGEEDVCDGRVPVRMDSPGTKGFFENHVHDHLADFGR